MRGTDKDMARLPGGGEAGATAGPGPKGQPYHAVWGGNSPEPHRPGGGLWLRAGGAAGTRGPPAAQTSRPLRPHLCPRQSPHPTCSLLYLCFVSRRFYPHRVWQACLSPHPPSQQAGPQGHSQPGEAAWVSGYTGLPRPPRTVPAPPGALDRGGRRPLPRPQGAHTAGTGIRSQPSLCSDLPSVPTSGVGAATTEQIDTPGSRVPVCPASQPLAPERRARAVSPVAS